MTLEQQRAALAFEQLQAVRQRPEQERRYYAGMAQKLPVLIRGAGTKLDWGRPAERIDVVLDMRRLNRVLAHEHGDLTATIEAGATLHDVNEALGRHGQWLPLGMMLAVGVFAWRAGSGLADASQELGETDPARLAVAGGTQILSFTIAALVAVPFATLGTSDAPFRGVGLGAAVLFALTGGVAFTRSSGLAEHVFEVVPEWVGEATRAGAAAIVCYLGLGAVLMVASLGIHHQRVEAGEFLLGADELYQ